MALCWAGDMRGNFSLLTIEGCHGLCSMYFAKESRQKRFIEGIPDPDKNGGSWTGD